MTSNIQQGARSKLCRQVISQLRGSWATTCLSDHPNKDVLLGALSFTTTGTASQTRPRGRLVALKSLEVGPAGLLEPFQAASMALEEGMAS